MSKLMKTALTCRGNGYLVVGVCIGLSLSLFMSPVEVNEDAGQFGDDSSWVSPQPQDGPDDYIPKLNLDLKPKKAQKVPKALVRPRYYSTELGIREKIFVGVSTSREHLHSRGVAVNKTLAHFVDKIRYFITIPEGAKPNVTLPGIVGFTDTRSVLKPFHIIKYITDNFLEEFDYYFIVNDAAYVDGKSLIHLVNKLSVSEEVYLGLPLEGDEDFCDLNAGILIGNSIVRKLKGNLDWCVKNTISGQDDVNFGRCVQHSTDLKCKNGLNDVKYTTTNIDAIVGNEIGGKNEKIGKKTENSGNLFKNELILNNLKLQKNSITIFPVLDADFAYKIHIKLTLSRLQEIDEEIEKIEVDYKKSKVFFKNSTDLFKNSWPIGHSEPTKPSGRFDIVRWNYFNESHIFMETDFENSRQIIGTLRSEIDEILEKIGKKYGDSLKFERLANGWRRFDGSRGADFIFDVIFTNSAGNRVEKRIEVAKTLGKPEILSVPYVTENSRVNLIVPVEPWRIHEGIEFLEHYSVVCLEKKEKTSLMFVLIYDPDSPSKGTGDVFAELKRNALELSEKFKKEQQSKISWLSVRVPVKSEGIHGNPMRNIAIADLVAKKFQPEHLLMFTEPKAILKPEFLNRVRMNTISQFQVFSPVPFAEFHPELAYENSNIVPEPDVVRNQGSYDDLNFETISFYVRDYLNVRKNAERDVPIVRNDKEVLKVLKLSRNNIVDSIFELFVVYGELHALRAVEPALKVKWREIECKGTEMLSERDRNSCETRRFRRLGNRGQLAKLILDFENHS